jgi:hypothetical protein
LSANFHSSHVDLDPELEERRFNPAGTKKEEWESAAGNVSRSRSSTGKTEHPL